MGDSDEKVQGYKERWVKAHEISKEWVARMTTLVECWNKLDGNVGELSSWVNTKDSAAPEGKSEISIEKLETQLNTLKTTEQVEELLQLLMQLLQMPQHLHLRLNLLLQRQLLLKKHLQPSNCKLNRKTLLRFL